MLKMQEETRSQISGLEQLLKSERDVHGKEVERAERREQAAAQREATAAQREREEAAKVATLLDEHKRETAQLHAKLDQKQAQLDQMATRLEELELQSREHADEKLRLEERLEATEQSQLDRNDKFLRMERQLVRLGVSVVEGTPTVAASTPAPPSRPVLGATPASARNACNISTPDVPLPSPPLDPAGLDSVFGSSRRKPPGSSAAVRSVSRHPAGREWQMPLASPATGADMLDRLEPKLGDVALPTPTRTPGLFFGLRR